MRIQDLTWVYCIWLLEYIMLKTWPNKDLSNTSKTNNNKKKNKNNNKITIEQPYWCTKVKPSMDFEAPHKNVFPWAYSSTFYHPSRFIIRSIAWKHIRVAPRQNTNGKKKLLNTMYSNKQKSLPHPSLFVWYFKVHPWMITWLVWWNYNN